MRILLDQAVHDHRNVGNNALLEAALGRLRSFWPDARFDVVSIAPHFCRTYWPGVQPVSPWGLQPREDRLTRLHGRVPRAVWRQLFEVRETLGQYSRRLRPVKGLGSKSSGARDGFRGGRTSLGSAGTRRSAGEAVEDAMSRAMDAYDLYAPTGGGYMCDSDKRFLLPLLDRIEAAASRGVPTVLLGQGVGPLRDAELRARISEVLPLAEWVFVRESLLAPALLESLGVDGRAIVTTGDDAVELAYAARPWTPGNGIGLSLRLASYTKVTGEHLGLIGNAVRLVAEKYDAPVIAVPIDANDADLCHIRRSLRGVRHARFPARRFETPLEVIRRAGSCRVMVSGTFHGAVFALSQGIPVVALSNSDEYLIKISGLAAAFGFRGCQIVELGNPRAGEKLAQALESLWRAADDLRPELLMEAQRQIEMAKAAYEKVRGLARRPANQATEKSTVSPGVSH